MNTFNEEKNEITLGENNESWNVRLLPDESKLICYPTLRFDSPDKRFNYYPDKIKYVKLERARKYLLRSTSTLYGVTANLKYLNPQLNKQELKRWCEYIIENHFFSPFEENTINTVVNWVMEKYESGQLNPNGELRRVIFNPAIGLTLEEKRSLTGQLTKRASALSEQIIYDVLEEMQNRDKPFSIKDVANQLGYSQSTLRRNITPELKELHKSINTDIRNNRDIKKYYNALEYAKAHGNPTSDNYIRKKCGFSGERFKKIKKLLR